MSERHTIRRIPGHSLVLLAGSPGSGRTRAKGIALLAAGWWRRDAGLSATPRTIRWMRPHPSSADPAGMDSNDTGTQYRIRIRGVMSDRLLSAFPEMQTRMRDHETELMGNLPDQSALHGVLGRIEALGLELLEVRRARARAGRSEGATRAEAETAPSADAN